MPCLPVDSATSCSSHIPNPSSAGSTSRVSLSRPARTAPARMPASSRPGWSSSGTQSAQADSIHPARRRSSATSAPARAAGTSPKCDSAEYRPPMSARLANTRRKPRSRPSSASGVSGSLMTAKFDGSGWRCQNHSSRLRVSAVVPDLEEATTRVCSAGSSAATRAIACGSTESSTWSSSPRAGRARLRATTSGNRLEPPIPSTTAWVRPSARACSVQRSSSATSSASSPGEVNQPSRSATSVGSSCQAVWSRFHSRVTTSRRWSSAVASATSEAMGARCASVCSAAVPIAESLVRMQSSRLSKEAAKLSSPSCWRRRPSDSRPTPASLAAAATFSAAAMSRPSVPVTSPSRSNASIVCSGIVLTVPAAARACT